MKTTLFTLCVLQWTSSVWSDLLRAGSTRRLDFMDPHDPPHLRRDDSRVSKRAFDQGLKRIKTLKQVAGSAPGGGFFVPEKDDPDWPGSYPPGNSLDADLCINIRLDLYPEEVVVNTRTVLSVSPELPDSEGTSPSKRAALHPSGNQTSLKGSIWTIPINSFKEPGALYQIEIADKAGDGICCGKSGNGWITITGRNETILWSATGNYTHVVTAYVRKDYDGALSVVYPQDSVPHEFVVRPTKAPDGDDDLPPELAGGNTSNISGFSCNLCPNGDSVGAPGRFVFPDDPESNTTCADLEYFFGLPDELTEEECLMHKEEKGFIDYYRHVCECPGFVPSCPMCEGDMVERPDVVPTDGGGYSCKQFESHFLYASASECSEMGYDVGTLKFYLETTCGCPNDGFA